MSERIHNSPTILDIDEATFRAEARKLLDLVRHDFQPNILLGIRSGGYFLAEAMAAQAGPEAPNLVSITRRRASTKSKSRLKIKGFLGRAPRSLKNSLRLLEHRVLMTFAARREVQPVVPDPVEDREFRAAIAACGDDRRILIVDDAVDSGATLLAVTQYVRDVAGERAEIRSAVITVTYPRPLIEPDYSLRRQVLCRFYWASDYA